MNEMEEVEGTQRASDLLSFLRIFVVRSISVSYQCNYIVQSGHECWQRKTLCPLFFSVLCVYCLLVVGCCLYVRVQPEKYTRYSAQGKVLLDAFSSNSKYHTIQMQELLRSLTTLAKQTNPTAKGKRYRASLSSSIFYRTLFFCFSSLFFSSSLSLLIHLPPSPQPPTLTSFPPAFLFILYPFPSESICFSYISSI